MISGWVPELNSGVHSDIHSDAILMQILAAERRSDGILMQF
jgi:hypothetical protein